MATIMIVDDEIMITKTLSLLLKTRNKCKVIDFNSPVKAMNYIKEKNEVDIIISDFIMPEMNGIDFLLEAKKELTHVESILLTGYADKENAIRSINEVGVYYYLEKPWNNEELLKIIKNALDKKRLAEKLDHKVVELQRSNDEINRLYDMLRNDYNEEVENSRSLMITLANIIEARDEYTDGHTRRVASIAKAIGKRLGLPSEDISTLEMAGIIHDIGKVSISDGLLNKKGKLTVEEFEIMKTHPIVGEKICRSLNVLEKTLKPILYHHEKLDGSGYPYGLKGDEIDTVTRIITVADMFDAMYSDRAYRKKMPYEKVKSILTQEAETGKLDIEITEILFTIIDNDGIDDVQK